MTGFVRHLPAAALGTQDSDRLLTEEWLVTNGLGGYASSTVLGVCTRRYHGLLVAALPAPLGRMVMFSHLSERLSVPNGASVEFGGGERAPGELDLPGLGSLAEFRLEQGLPVWRYEAEGVAVEKRVLLVHQQNTVHISYRLVAGDGPVDLELRPSLHFRHHEDSVSEPLAVPYVLTVTGDRYEITAQGDAPPLRMLLVGEGGALTVEPGVINDTYYRGEASRGYEAQGQLWRPGYFNVQIARGSDATLIASTEGWETVMAMQPPEALAAELERRNRLLIAARVEPNEVALGELALAADQFVIAPAGRVEDAARAHATGDEVRTVIAGYHWFTDWGRDTMISLPGLTLATRRYSEAGYILRTFAHYIRDGLIPNMFLDMQKEGLYHTADATLWYFHALDRYLAATGDRETLRLLLPKLEEMVDAHIQGTHFGIGVDPADGLLRQGADGYQLTWMDAKVGDWVVTPRRGKAVEINALWYNALRLLEGWLRTERGGAAAQPIAAKAEQASASFNARFWYEAGGYLYDVVDGENGDDAVCRPNQLFAISLPHPVLRQELWEPVVETVRTRLLTPVGLRSLAPSEPDYKERYFGDLRSRDAAYHQGTVWAWLIGPFIDAWLKVHPEDRQGARAFLDGLIAHLGDAGLGTISEVFDASEPFTPRGCIAQAWSVAEVLRCLRLTGEPSPLTEE